MPPKLIVLVKPYGKSALALVLVLGAFVLLMWHPLWLAPPYIQYTIYIYLGLVAGAWLLLFYHFYRVPIPGGWKLLTVAVCLFLSCCWCTLVAPSIPFPGLFTTFSCEEESLGDGRIRYICTRQSIEERTVYTLEGRQGWGLVWQVDQEFHP